MHALKLTLRVIVFLRLSLALCRAQNKSHALNDEIVVNALAGVVGVGVTYIKDDEDIVPLLKARCYDCAAFMSHALAAKVSRMICQHIIKCMCS